MQREKEEGADLKEGEDFTVTEGGPEAKEGGAGVAESAAGNDELGVGLSGELETAEREVERGPGLSAGRRVLEDFVGECGAYFDREVPITAPIADASELSKHCAKIMSAVVNYAATWRDEERVEEEAFLGAILCLRVVLCAREYKRDAGALSVRGVAEMNAKAAERERQKKFLEDLKNAQAAKRKSAVSDAKPGGEGIDAEIAAKADAAKSAAVAAAERIRGQSKGNVAAGLLAGAGGGNAARILASKPGGVAERIIGAGQSGVASQLLAVAGAGRAAQVLGHKPVVPGVAGGVVTSGKDHEKSPE